MSADRNGGTAGVGERSRRRVVVIGGGYVGAPLARALDADHDVTLIDKLPVFFHRMAALRAAVDPESTTLPFLSRDRLLANGRIVTGEVVDIRPDERRLTLSDGSEIDYDVAVIATGELNQPVAQFAGSSLESAQAHVRTLQRQIADAPAIAVIGGGITGVELAGEITSAHPGKPVVLFTRGRIVPDLPEKAARALTRQRADRGVRILTDRPVAPDRLASELTAAGLDPDSTVALWTVGGTPESAWLRRARPAWVGDHGIVVDQYLRVGGDEHHFAVGDVAATDGPRGAMVARQQIPVVAANIAAGAPVKAYVPGGPRIALVPLGPSGGVVSIGVGAMDLRLGGRAAAKAKGRTLMTPTIDRALGNR